MNHNALVPVTDTRLISGSPIELDEQLFFKEAMVARRPVMCQKLSRLVMVNFNLHQWVVASFTPAVHAKNTAWMMDEGCAIVYSGEFNVRVNIQCHRNAIIFQIYYTDPQAAASFEKWLDTQGFQEKEIEIKWAFGPDYSKMEVFEVPLQCPPPVANAYPWITESVEDYTAKFLASTESILILIGPPGTGKTTFLKQMIKASASNAMVTYETGLLFSDGFFANYMSSRGTNMLVLEDADHVMGSRKDGNSGMHRFLNASDGLISMKGKKLVFSTNLPSVNDIDPALLRPGRCFDVLNFRSLTKDEAQLVANGYYKEPVVLDQSKYSLAEVLNLGSTLAQRTKPKVGFV